jgi:hypothetical protein
MAFAIMYLWMNAECTFRSFLVPKSTHFAQIHSSSQPFILWGNEMSGLADDRIEGGGGLMCCRASN